MRRILVVMVWAVATTAQAAPFLVSDPWSASGAQPTSCVYQEGTAAAVEAPVVSMQEGVACRFDLASVTKTAHSYEVWARSAWGASTRVPFVFSASVPVAPTGMRITP